MFCFLTGIFDTILGLFDGVGGRDNGGRDSGGRFNGGGVNGRRYGGGDNGGGDSEGGVSIFPFFICMGVMGPVSVLEFNFCFFFLGVW